MSDEERLRSALQALAYRALAAVLEHGGAVAPLVVTAAADGALRITLLVDPAVVPVAPVGPLLGENTSPLITSCERDILAVLAAVGDRLTTPRVHAELEKRGLVHGESTVKKALAHLSHLGLVEASRRRPQGYALPRTSGLS